MSTTPRSPGPDPTADATRLLVEVAGRIYRWRFLTNERRAELILLLADALTELHCASPLDEVPE